jgi:predicted MFS family arabinose efflux permease
MEVRGRVMGVVQTAFAASQVLGLPFGLYLSNHWGWHAPFLMIGTVSTLAGGLILAYLRPINAHLTLKPDRSPLHHLLQTVTTPRYLQGFATTALLSTGGFMLMPFGSAFSVHNLGISMEMLPLVYLVTGACSIVFGPLLGKASDTFGKFPVFFFGSLLTMVMVLIYTRLGLTPMALVILVSVVMFVGVSSRMISASALISAVPKPVDRGAYMSISSSLQQISGGLASALAGIIVIQAPDGSLHRYELLGYVVAGTSCFTIAMMYFINRMVQGGQTAMPQAPAMASSE